MKKLLLILLAINLNSCSSDINYQTKENEESKTIESKADIEFRQNAIGDHIKSHTILSDNCEDYFTHLMLEANLFPENIKIVEFLEVEPDSVIPSRFYNPNDGVFIYTKMLSIENTDTLWHIGTGFFDNSTQILTHTKIIDKGIFEIDSMTQIYLPFKDSVCNCGKLNLDTSYRVPFVPFGSWSRVNKNGEPLK